MSLSTEIQDKVEDTFNWTNVHNHDPSNEDQFDHIDWEKLNEQEWAKFLCEVERDDEPTRTSTSVIPMMKTRMD
ncbi:hypothetical protein E1B28_006772 [Marasmius oreades]|uniref:Uncharacterized protein n=1 Tax=Marasmius oreades TaxID=181124 RepID=A0A9P7UWR9_9AGAR|nr:uncharacterized protein E1B28_006772 [Marasmius oreades]KAG7096096.1 hypothetical protein E1B28_006772 [Marasmius oreades]